jgi:hypothetical protein
MREGRLYVDERKQTHTVWFYLERRNKGGINLGVIAIGGQDLIYIRGGMRKRRFPVNGRKQTHTVWFYLERRNKGKINLGVIAIGGRELI